MCQATTIGRRPRLRSFAPSRRREAAAKPPSASTRPVTKVSRGERSGPRSHTAAVRLHFSIELTVRAAAACLLGLISLGLGQAVRPLDPTVAATRERIRILDARFQPIIDSDRWDCPADCPPDTRRRLLNEMFAELNQVTSRMHAEVDAFVIRTVKREQADLNKDEVGRGLREILPPVDNDPRSVFLLKTANRRSLVVAYNLFKGSMMGDIGVSMTIRAYSETPVDPKLADETGADMNGYRDVSVTELHSTFARSLLLLASGYASGANGPNNRMRLYAYDGEKFRTLWMPEDIWGQFDVKAVDNGFTVEGDYYRVGGKRRDRYLVSDDSVSLLTRESVR